MRKQQLHQQQRSLSPAVQDALFSYWRLSQRQRDALEGWVPPMELAASSTDTRSLGLRTDWPAFALRLAGCQAPEAVRPTELAWAVAIQAEKLVRSAQHASFWRSDSLQTLGVTHSAQLQRLVEAMSDECGDFYLSFTVLITILERALYDVYHAHEEQTAVTNGSSSKTPNSGQTKKKKNLILRDLLQSETLQRVLPAGLLQLLKILFLPSGLNLRNLVWHGFVIPADVPKCWGSLTFVLIVAVAEYLPGNEEDSGSSSLFSTGSYDSRFVLDESTMPPDWTCESLDSILKISASSAFVPSGRIRLVERALRALLVDQDELLFLFALLPVLEHAVRMEFLHLNQRKFGISSEYGRAQIDAYYSTLDGFGQREKHQVLLHPRILLESSSDVRPFNALYGDLPVASLAIWLDLFMMASGPNLRAKLCHGEASLATLLQPKQTHSLTDNPPISVTTRLVLCAWIAVCDHKSKSAENGSAQQALISAIDPFVASYSSSFHPFFQLRRALSTTQARMWEFAVFRQRWSALRMLPLGEDGDEQTLMRVEFIHADLAKDGMPFSLADKIARIEDFKALLTDAPPLKPRSDGFVSLLVELKQTLETVSTVLIQHFEKYHKEHYLHEGPSCTMLSQDLTYHQVHVVADGVHEVELPMPRSLEAYLLALGDEEGLSAASCMMETILSCKRSLDTFKQRFGQLYAMIQAGTARTNHRRSFLRSVFFIPIFEQLQLVCLSFVEHQVVYLAARVTRDAKEGRQVSRTCPCVRQVETVQTKLLQFVTAFEGCTGSAEASQKSSEKALQLAVQFLNSKTIKTVLRASI